MTASQPTIGPDETAGAAERPVKGALEVPLRRDVLEHDLAAASGRAIRRVGSPTKGGTNPVFRFRLFRFR
ncbi:hypothetical protein BN873_10040 [Candidatus Competibacter denitrificans Run_A_D11]|uniref:Uncharacterized protein n=1 Tax=Candidatus Competibacter denitrificans Run_A_D11 TaxID=1400863 RepID=W6M2S1_9GAMM|nr:hypothetical protein BN873_10040 [Candidatus Competibacter denitrificans Run_A_D11]